MSELRQLAPAASAGTAAAPLPLHRPTCQHVVCGALLNTAADGWLLLPGQAGFAPKTPPVRPPPTEASSCSAEELAAWIEAAEQCQQVPLKLACVGQLVQRLVCQDPTENMAAGIADAMHLQRLDKSTLLLVLGLVTGANRRLVPSAQRRAFRAPSQETIASCICSSANPGSFEWRIDRFSRLPAQPGIGLGSPWFIAGGRTWRLELYPNGDNVQSEGNLSGAGSCNDCSLGAYLAPLNSSSSSAAAEGGCACGCRCSPFSVCSPAIPCSVCGHRGRVCACSCGDHSPRPSSSCAAAPHRQFSGQSGH